MRQFVAYAHSLGGYLGEELTLYVVETSSYRRSATSFKAVLNLIEVLSPVFYGVSARSVESMA